jgi:nickel-dependent lactate racemase
MGITSFETPVLVNRHVVYRELILGIGGPTNYSVGFGGGSKLALSVVGFHWIARLHYGHQSVGWGASHNLSTFRPELDEIAQLLGSKPQ